MSRSKMNDFVDPYELPSKLPLANGPFLSGLIFGREGLLKPYLNVTVVDATRNPPLPRTMIPNANSFWQTEVPTKKASNYSLFAEREKTDVEESILPSAIDDPSGVGSGIHRPVSSDDDGGRRPEEGTALDAHPPIATLMEHQDDGETQLPFSLRVEELERRMTEQLEVHRQLNTALSQLDLVHRQVREAVEEEAIAKRMMTRELNDDHPTQSQSCQKCHPEPRTDVSVVQRQQLIIAGPAAQLLQPSTGPAAAAATAKASLPPAVSATPSKITIVRPPSPPQVYVRKVLRPKPVAADQQTVRDGIKTVSIAEGAPIVTHFDRDSPAVSTARRSGGGLLGQNDASSRARMADSVRVSSSMESSAFRESVATPMDIASTVPSSVMMSRTDSSSTSVRVSYVDRNLASSRRSVSMDDIPTVMSSSSSSSTSTSEIAESLASTRSSFSRGKSSEAQYESPAAMSQKNSKRQHHHLGLGGGQLSQLYDVFHQLCQRAHNALGGIETTAGGRRSSPISDHDRSPSPTPTPSTQGLPLGRDKKHRQRDTTAVEDVMRLQQFIRLLRDDVQSLEVLRKARKAREELLLRAKRIALARRKMLLNKQLALSVVEDEIGVSLSQSVKRTRGRGGDDDMIEDDVIMEASMEQSVGRFGRSHGQFMEEDIIEDDEVGMEDDMGIEEDYGDVADEVGDSDDFDVEDEAFGSGAFGATTTLLEEEEEDFADYLIEHDEDDLVQRGAPIKLIRYGGAKTKKDEGDQRQRQDAHHHRGRSDAGDSSSRASSLSYYSSVEDEEENQLEAERRQAMMAAASKLPVMWIAAGAAAVEEEEGLRPGHVSTSSSSDHSTVDSSVKTSLAAESNEAHPAFASGTAAEGLRRMASKKLSSQQLKRTRSQRKSVVAVEVEKAPSTVNEEEEASFLRSSESSNDADVTSKDPDSTQYTSSTTTVDSSVELPPVPRYRPDQRKFIDRQKWMETEKRRRKALRSIAPLMTFTELYDPCESTPSASSQSDTSGTDNHPNAPGLTLRAVLEAEPLQHELSVTVSPLSMATTPMVIAKPVASVPMTFGLVMTPDELQALGDRQLQRYPILTQSQKTNDVGSESDDDASQHSSSSERSDSVTSYGAPRVLLHTPPPPPPPPPVAAGSTTPMGSQELLPPPLITPLMSFEGGPLHHQHRDSMVLQGGSVDVFDTMRRNYMTADMEDHVAVHATPIEPRQQQLSYAEARVANETNMVVYERDDLVALQDWKSRQLETIRELLAAPADGGAAVSLEGRKTGDTEEEDEEVKYGREAVLHWGMMEALLNRRFGGCTSSSSSSSSCESRGSQESTTESYSDESDHSSQDSDSERSDNDRLVLG